jgi:ribosomal protein S20
MRLLDMILLYSTFKESAVRSIFSPVFLAASLAVVIGATAGCSGMTEKTNAAAGTTAEIGSKIDNAVRRGISSGNTAATNATKAAEGPIDRTAKKIGLPRGPASSPSSSERGGN